MKTILIAVPTIQYMDVETFESIFYQDIPEGYSTYFKTFTGDQIDDIRNTIVKYALDHDFDYLFSVDSDITLPLDTLKRLLAHDTDIVSGLYIQRKVDAHILELYKDCKNIIYDQIKNAGVIEVDGCGFGCALIKTNVFKEVGYPQFVYHSALDHKYTTSEDNDFCGKARAKGFKVYADTSILCGHIGNCLFKV